MDWEPFRVYLRVVEGKAETTTDDLVRKLRFAQRAGFDAARFLTDAAAARELGDAWLAARRVQAGAYNNDVKALNALARFAGHEHTWRRRREPPAVPRDYGDQEIVRLLEWDHADRFVALRGRALVRWCLAMGMRRAEISAMDEADLDAAESEIYVSRAGKGGLRRPLPVPAHMWSSRQPFGAWLRARPRAPDDPGAVWVTLTAPFRRLEPPAIGVMMNRIGRDVGVRAGVHRFRHTLATRLARAGIDVYDLQYLLGHSKLESTARYIRRSDVETLRRALRRAGIPGYKEG